MATLHLALEILGAAYACLSIVVNLPSVRDTKWGAKGRKIVAEIGSAKDAIAADK